MTTEHKILCPACASNNTESINITIKPSARNEVIYHKCKKCKSFFNPDIYDLSKETKHIELTSWGNRESGIKLSSYKSLMYESVLNILNTYSPPPATLIDIGCSYTGFIAQAQNKGYQVCGMEILPDAADFAKSEGFDVVQAASVSDLDNKFDKLKFDVVSVLDTNYYFKNQKEELRNIRNILIKNGILIMRVVDKSLFFQFGIYIHKIIPSIGRRIIEMSVNDHLFSMPVKSLINLLESNGYRIFYASPKGAQHSKQTSLLVKILFRIGYLFWAISGKNVAPGYVIVAKKM